MSAPRFSVVIPCLATESLLQRVLASLKDQSFQDFECIVVDDGSNPPLEAVAKSFGVGYIRNEENLGRAKTRNLGIAKAKGEIILFLDVDQILDPLALEEWDKCFRQNMGQAVRGNVALQPDIAQASNYGRYYNSRFLGQRRTEALKGLDLENLPPKFFATGSIAVPADIVRSLNGFSDEFNAYGCEDEDFGVRLCAAGHRLKWGMAIGVYDGDSDLSLRRACERMVTYARESAPVLLRRHPSYLKDFAFGIFEVSPSGLGLPSQLKRSVLKALLTPPITRAILLFLERRDKSAARPPDALYQLALAGHYLMGVKGRPKS